MKESPAKKCPVCDQLVGKEPHESCLASLVSGADVAEAQAMPCPACGETMANGTCKNGECPSLL